MKKLINLKLAEEDTFVFIILYYIILYYIILYYIILLNVIKNCLR